MSKAGDPRDGLHLRLDLERALNVQDVGPRIGAGLSYAATKAINSPLFQRLQQQIEENDPTARVLEERVREINITNVAQQQGLNRADLEEIMRNLPPGPSGPPGPPGPAGAPASDPGDRRRRPGEDQPPRSGPSGGKRAGSFDESGPPPPPAPGAANEAYRMNVQLQAEVEGLKEEMMKQQRQMHIAQEVQNRMEAQNRDPRKEIIREFQQVIQPALIPVPQQPQDHSRLMSIFERAMASNNHNLGQLAQQMGLSMQQIVEMLKAKEKEGPSATPVTSNMPPPPPPPPPPAAAVVAEKFDGPPRSRSRSAQPTAAPPPHPPPPREASLASTVDYRSRSRSLARHEPVLPIKEEPQQQRGRSLTRKADTAVAQRAVTLLMQKQRQAQQEGQIRTQLGKFARGYQAQLHARAATAPPPPKARTYDQIEKEIEETGEPSLRKQIRFPEGAFFARQRVNTPGERRLMHQGRAVVV